MTEFDGRFAPTPDDHNGDLFGWRGDDVVLLAEQVGETWVVARSWAQGDRLIDVRRWTFRTPRALAVQMQRLAREATGNVTEAAAVATAVLAWALPRQRPEDRDRGWIAPPSRGEW